VANQNIFCNTPWYEAHIYWDGSLGICCQESRKLYNQNQKFNIKDMTLADWFNSEPVRQLRKSVLSDVPTDVCNRCYNEESLVGTSRRHRSNQKSVIFTRTAFQASFEQSPGRQHFTNDGITDTMPIDLHVDLGNYCNLACKMCWSGASSRIATQMVKWGHEDHRQYLGNDWTKDSTTWTRFLKEILAIPKFKNIHFMGGETLITDRFEQFVDFMIDHQRFDICMSFVTNGTTFNESIINKLKRFARVGIEVSIESITPHNDYVRQGTDTQVVLENIQRYQQHCNGSSITLTVRPAISALTVGYYHTLIKYCLEQRLLIKSLLVTNPTCLNVNVLPLSVRTQYKEKYLELLDSVSEIDVSSDYNESDPNNYLQSIKIQLVQAITALEEPTQEHLLKDLVDMCRQWDNEFKFDALKLYPELADIFTQYGYQNLPN